VRSRRLQLAIVCALVASGAAAGCGDEEQAGELSALVPPDVPLYAEVVLRPDEDQRAAIEALTAEVAGIEDPGGQIVSLLDDALAEEPGDFTYAEDIEPWLGDRAAFFIRSFEGDGMEPDGAALVEVTDADAAQDFIDRVAEADPEFPPEERSYEGVDYRADEENVAVGLVDDAVVIGTEEAFKVAVDTSGGESLGESDEYDTRTEALDDDQLGVLYLEPEAPVQAAVASGDLTPDGARIARGLLAGPLAGPVTVGVAASADAATVDVVASVDGAGPVSAAGALAHLPAGAWLAADIPNAGSLLETWLDALAHSGVPQAASIERGIAAQTGLDPRRDVTSWLGDTAFFFSGTEESDFSLGLIAEASDPEGPRALVERLTALAEAESPIPLGGPPEGAEYGFSAGVPVLGPRAEVGVVDDRFVAALGTTVAQLLEPEESLGGDEGFKAALDQLGAEFLPLVYLDVPQGFELAVRGADSAAEAAEYESERPYVEKLGSFVAGVRADGDLLVSRLILTLAQ
jgi:hypothetical protein